MPIPGYQLGDNLYGDDQGRYFSIQNGAYQLPNGQSMNGSHRVFQSSPWDTEQNQVNSLYGAQQKQQLGALKAQQQTALNGINLQQKNSNAGFYAQKNQADVTNAQNAQKMRETMAANGLNTSGENVTATAGLNAQRMGALNDINNQQNQANAQFASQRADINNPQHAQDIINQVNEAKSQALMTAFQNALARMYQQHSDWQNQQNTLAAQQLQKYGIDMTAKYNQGLTGSNFQGSSGGGGTVTPSKGFQADLAAANKRGLNPADNAALSWIVQHESSFNPNAKNPKGTAYGYGQFIKANQNYYSKKMGLDYNNPVDQLLMMEQYMKDRYGSAQNAEKYWQQHGNY